MRRMTTFFSKKEKSEKAVGAERFSPSGSEDKDAPAEADPQPRARSMTMFARVKRKLMGAHSKSKHIDLLNELLDEAMIYPQGAANYNEKRILGLLCALDEKKPYINVMRGADKKIGRPAQIPLVVAIEKGMVNVVHFMLARMQHPAVLVSQKNKKVQSIVVQALNQFIAVLDKYQKKAGGITKEQVKGQMRIMEIVLAYGGAEHYLENDRITMMQALLSGDDLQGAADSAYAIAFRYAQRNLKDVLLKQDQFALRAIRAMFPEMQKGASPMTQLIHLHFEPSKLALTAIDVLDTDEGVEDAASAASASVGVFIDTDTLKRTALDALFDRVLAVDNEAIFDSNFLLECVQCGVNFNAPVPRPVDVAQASMKGSDAELRKMERGAQAQTYWGRLIAAGQDNACVAVMSGCPDPATFMGLYTTFLEARTTDAVTRDQVAQNLWYKMVDFKLVQPLEFLFNFEVFTSKHDASSREYATAKQQFDAYLFKCQFITLPTLKALAEYAAEIGHYSVMAFLVNKQEFDQADLLAILKRQAEADPTLMQILQDLVADANGVRYAGFFGALESDLLYEALPTRDELEKGGSNYYEVGPAADDVDVAAVWAAAKAPEVDVDSHMPGQVLASDFDESQEGFIVNQFIDAIRKQAFDEADNWRRSGANPMLVDLVIKTAKDQDTLKVHLVEYLERMQASSTESPLFSLIKQVTGQENLYALIEIRCVTESTYILGLSESEAIEALKTHGKPGSFLFYQDDENVMLAVLNDESTEQCFPYPLENTLGIKKVDGNCMPVPNQQYGSFSDFLFNHRLILTSGLTRSVLNAKIKKSRVAASEDDPDTVVYATVLGEADEDDESTTMLQDKETPVVTAMTEASGPGLLRQSSEDGSEDATDASAAYEELVGGKLGRQ